MTDDGQSTACTSKTTINSLEQVLSGTQSLPIAIETRFTEGNIGIAVKTVVALRQVRGVT